MGRWDDWAAIDGAQRRADREDAQRRAGPVLKVVPPAEPVSTPTAAPGPSWTPSARDAAVLEQQQRRWEAERQPVDDVRGLTLYLRVLRGMAMRALEKRDKDEP